MLKKFVIYLLTITLSSITFTGFASSKDTVFVILSKKEILKENKIHGTSKDRSAEFWSDSIPDQPIHLHHITGWHKVLKRPKSYLKKNAINSDVFYKKTLDELIKYFWTHVVFVINRKDWHSKNVLCQEVVLLYHGEE